MNEDRVELRVNFSAREIAIAGSSKSVEKWMAHFDSLIDAFRGNTAQKLTVPQIKETGIGVVESQNSGVDTFGEFLHQFNMEVTNVDRALIAGQFLQTKSEDQSFSTRQVSELLLEQGYKLANPSMSVQRNVSARRVFTISTGRFRVSREGIDYLTALRNASE